MASTQSDIRCTGRLNPGIEYLYALAAEAGDNKAGRRALMSCLDRAIHEDLTENQRRVLHMYYHEGLNTPAIAAQLGVNKSTVCRSLHSSRKKLQELLKYSVLLVNREADA